MKMGTEAGRYRWVIVYIYLILLCFPACDFELKSVKPGYYEGQVSTQASGRNLRIPVGALLVREDADRLEVQVRSKRSPKRWKIVVEKLPDDEMRISIDIPQVYPQILRRRSSNCYSSGADILTSQVKFCFNEREASLTIGSSVYPDTITVVLDFWNAEKIPSFETPASYSIDELTVRALNRNFKTLLQFQAVLAARKNLFNAVVGMAPRPTINGAGALVSMDFFQLFNAIGDLAPFLLPNRWFQLFAIDAQTEAEFYAFAIMQADTAHQAEVLSHINLRDVALVESLTKYQAQVESLLQEIVLLEKKGTLEVGSSDQVQSLQNAISRQILDVRAAIGAELTELAQMTGFQNPEAIREVLRPKNLPSVKTALVPSDVEEIRRSIFIRSFELKQIEYYLESANDSLWASRLSWMDPSTGNPVGAAAPSEVPSWEIKKSFMESTLEQKLVKSIGEIKLSIDLYLNLTKEIETENKNNTRLMAKVRAGDSGSLVAALLAYEKRMRADLDTLGCDATYNIALAQIERLLLSGKYAELGFKHF